MLRRLSRPVLGIALVLSIGLHWPLLQSVAWMGMLVSYSRDFGVQEAISRTLDGKHPCKLCKLVSEAKKAEKKNPIDTSLKKLDQASITERSPFIHPELELAVTPYICAAVHLPHPPVSPPPELA